MAEIFAGIMTFIIFCIITFGPIALIIWLVLKFKKSKKRKEQDQQKKIKINNQIRTNEEEIEEKNILFEEDKEEIDEYYDNQYIPYRAKYLLTKNEWNFYQELKKIANEKHLTVLAKIRMADLVEVEPMNKNQWKYYFNRISKKHIDFALARPENLKIILLIELDDYSHESKQYERDKFVEAVYKKTGYKLLRVKNAANLKNKIDEILKY